MVRTSLLAVVLIALAACGGDAPEVPELPPSGFEELSDDALQDRSNVCRGIVPPGDDDDVDGSAASVQVCDNIKNECLRRRRQGRFPC